MRRARITCGQCGTVEVPVTTDDVTTALKARRLLEFVVDLHAVSAHLDELTERAA